jgi:hypothetical protein
MCGGCVHDLIFSLVTFFCIKAKRREGEQSPRGATVPATPLPQKITKESAAQRLGEIVWRLLFDERSEEF